MGQILHGSAQATEAVRRVIQRSEQSVSAPARRHGISRTTVQRWRKRASVSDVNRVEGHSFHGTHDGGQGDDLAFGTVKNFVCGRAAEHHSATALMDRSPKMKSNLILAIDHSRSGIFRSLSDRFKISWSSLVSASSLGKCSGPDRPAEL